MHDFLGTFKNTVSILQQNNFRHEIHTYPSGTGMIDVWQEESFYVLQFEKDFIGFSEINDENPGFDVTPDLIFKDGEKFEAKLQTVLNLHAKP